MEEKRKSIRVRGSNLTVLFKVKNARLAGGSRIKDISEIGLCILSKYHFPVDSVLEMEIRSDNLKEPIKTLGRVVRIVNCNNSKFQFEVGIVFLDLSLANNRITLRNYIQRFMTQENQDINWLD